MSDGLRPAQGDIDGAVSSNFIELFHGELILLDGLIEE